MDQVLLLVTGQSPKFTMSAHPSPKDELINTMQPDKRMQASKEQLTPHKLSLMVVISVYHDLHTSAYGEVSADGWPSHVFSEKKHRQVMTTILDLLQSPDMKFEELREDLSDLDYPTLVARFDERVSHVMGDDYMAVADFIEALGTLVLGEHSEVSIHRASVVGIFIRRMWLSFNQMTFSQLNGFHAQLKAYLHDSPVLSYRSRVYLTDSLPTASTKDTASPMVHGFQDSFGGSLTESMMSGTGDMTGQQPDTALRRLDLITVGTSNDKEKISYSQKQTELFISQQASLLTLDENKALSPKQLQSKLSSMLEQHPDIAEAHFLSYLNNLRVKEYCTAVHNLFHYFDRNAQSAGDTVGTSTKKPEDEVSRRYAALNLAALQFNFGHRGEAKTALMEAIRMAQESNDHVCLQHALSWLNMLGDSEEGQVVNQMERSVEKSHELNLPYLTSLGVQALAKHSAFASVTPGSVFEYMMQSNVINCQNSMYNLMSISGTQRAGLWSYYGNRECASLCAQLVLCLDTEDKGCYYNGESSCLALCLLARLHADKGDHSAANEILQHACGRFPPCSQYAHLWQACEQSLIFEKAILSGNFSEAEKAAHNLRVISSAEGRLQLARLLKERGEVTESLQILHKLKEECTGSKELTPDFLCRVLLLMVEVLVVTDNHTASLPNLTHCLTHASAHHLQYLGAMTTLYLAVIQMHMKLPGQALQLIESAMLIILSHGSLYDRARLLNIYARCKVAESHGILTSRRSDALLSAANQMSTVVNLFQSLGVTHRVKDALYYQARVYHELGYTAERNKCAHKFKQMEQQSPTLNKIFMHFV